MMMSLRKSASEIPGEPRLDTLFAHASNSGSCVTPRSSVIGSCFQMLGETRCILGSPPSRCSTGSVDRLSALHLLTPATYLPSHFSRNFMFL